jgi:hypothetical protein
MQSSNLPSTALHLITDGLARMRIASRWMKCFLLAAAFSASVSLPVLGQLQEQTSSSPVPASAIPALARGLVEDCRRLVEAVLLESGNAPWKHRMEVRVNALLKAAEHFERGAKWPATNLDQQREAIENVRQAYQPIAGELALTALNAPAVRRIAERIGLKITSLERAMQPAPMVPPPGGPYDRAALQAALRSTQAAAGNLVFLLGHRLGTAAPDNRIMEDLRAWNQQLVAYQRFVELSHPPLAQAQARFHPLRNSARDLGRQLERARPPQTIAPAWNSLQTSLEVARTMLRLGPKYVMQSEPDLAREERLRRALVHELTGLIAEMDTFMVGLSDKVPEGPQIRIEALALRDALNRLRRHAAAGTSDGRIIPDLAVADNAHRALAAHVERVNQNRQPGPNVLRVRRIGEALARIQNAAPGF